MNVLLKFGIVLSAIFLSGCERWTARGSETEAEICRQFGASLPSLSRSDSAQTISEVQLHYATFVLTCPNYEHLIPNKK